MEELVEKYHEAERRGNSLFFAISNFESTRLPLLSFGAQSILEILCNFERKTGFIRISNGTVVFTKKGLIEAQKITHDWC
jgi:hypothetical protein